MKIIVSITVLIALVIVVEGWFDCRRAGLNCQHDTVCNYTSGLCDCSDPDLAGEDCGYNKTLAAQTSCSPPCQNGGSCLNSTSASECYCPSDFTGDQCQFKRVEVECSGTNMNVTIRPYPGFAGSIYVRDNKTDSQCIFSETSSGSGFYTLSFSLNGPDCSNVEKNNTPSANDTTYERVIFVQYSQFFETANDQVVRARCTVKAQEVSDINGTFGSVDTEGGKFKGKDAASTVEPVKFVVEQSDGKPITPPSKVGDDLRLYFALKDKGVFNNFLVEECTVNNGLTGADRKSLLLIQNSCLTMASKQVIRGVMKRDDSIPSLVLPFAAFKFDNSPDLAFSCKVRVCKTGDTKCNPKSCNMGQGFGRRRRDVASDASDGSEKVVEQRITVVEVGARNGLITGSQPTETSCFSKPEVLTVVVVLGALCLMLLLLATIMATRHFRRSSGVPHKELDAQSTYSSSFSSQLHIPRVKTPM